MSNVNVKGCGCRYRDQECEHLCDKHRDEFILRRFNADIILNKMIEEDAKSMEDMYIEMEEIDGKSLETGEVGFKYKLNSIEKE